MLCKKPLHQTLRNYRVLHIVVILFLIWLTNDVWEYVKVTFATLQSGQAVGIMGIFSTLVAGLFAFSRDANTKVEKDDHE